MQSFAPPARHLPASVISFSPVLSDLRLKLHVGGAGGQGAPAGHGGLQAHVQQPAGHRLVGPQLLLPVSTAVPLLTQCKQHETRLHMRDCPLQLPAGLACQHAWKPSTDFAIELDGAQTVPQLQSRPCGCP